MSGLAGSAPGPIGIGPDLALILDVLRANRLHESRCALLRTLHEEEAANWLIPGPRPDCDCWLADERQVTWDDGRATGGGPTAGHRAGR